MVGTKKLCQWFVSIIMVLATIVGAMAVYDYDTFTRADNSSFGVSEGRAISYTDSASSSLVNQIGLFGDYYVVGLPTYISSTLYANVSFNYVGSEIGLTKNGVRACTIWCVLWKQNLTLALQNNDDFPFTNYIDLGVPCKDGNGDPVLSGFHEYRVSYNATSNMCTASVDGNTPVSGVFQGSGLQNGIDSFRGNAVDVDKWAVCEGNDMSCIDTYPTPVCDPDWSCAEYGSCQSGDHKFCTSMVDVNNCGEQFTGDLNDYNQSCDYCTPSWSCSAYDSCQLGDIKFCATANDTNQCGESFTGNINLMNQTCDYCTPHFACQSGDVYYGECQSNNLRYCLQLDDHKFDCAADHMSDIMYFMTTKMNTLNISCTYCVPSWNCSEFTSCLIDSHKYCLEASDVNQCGQTFTGNLDLMNESCNYCYPEWGTSWKRGECSNHRYNTTLTYVDSQNCGSRIGIPSDNGTMYYGACTVEKKGVIKFRNIKDSVVVDNVNVSMVLGTSYNGNLSITQLENLPTKIVDLGIGSSLKKIVDINFDPLIMELTEADLRIYYTKEEIRGLTEKNLKLYFYNDTAFAWQVVVGSGVNLDEDYVYGTVKHFSYYGIGGDISNVTAYNVADLRNIIVDGMGTAGSSFVSNIGLLMTLLVLSLLVGGFAYAAKMFKK
jgi:hypothetical protein